MCFCTPLGDFAVLHTVQMLDRSALAMALRWRWAVICTLMVQIKMIRAIKLGKIVLGSFLVDAESLASIESLLAMYADGNVSHNIATAFKSFLLMTVLL